MVEVDLRYKNNKLYFGHDFPQYHIDIQWILDRKNFLLLHVKDDQALRYLINSKVEVIFFGHENDNFTLINNKQLRFKNILAIDINVFIKKKMLYNKINYIFHLFR